MSHRVAALMAGSLVIGAVELALAGGPNIIYNFSADLTWSSGLYRDWTNPSNDQFLTLDPPVTGNVAAHLEGVSIPYEYNSGGYDGVRIGSFAAPGNATATAPSPIGAWNNGTFQVSTEVWTYQPTNERVLRILFQYSGWIDEPNTSATIQSDHWVRGVSQEVFDEFRGYIFARRSDLFINAFNSLTPNYRNLITAHDQYLPGSVPGISHSFYGSVDSISATLVPAPAPVLGAGATLLLIVGHTSRRRRPCC